MKRDVEHLLRERGIQPSAQRIALAEYVLDTVEHPCAEEVWSRVGARIPMLSRATVYNTLNLFVEMGLLRELTLAEGKTVFDPNMEPHHHFVDEKTGEIHDIPWGAVRISKVEEIKGFEIREYSLVMRGRRLKKGAPPSSSSSSGGP